MMEWLKTYSRLIWWVAMVLFFSLVTMELWRPTFYGDFRYIKGNGIILFLVWIALLLWPLFKEINLFGLSLKKEIDSLKSEIKEQRLEFKEQIVNLKSEINVGQHVNINLSTPPYTAESPKVAPVPNWVGSIKPSDDALKILSTLWKHQQQYNPNMWKFAVGPLNPNYPIYQKGKTETTQLGLTAYCPDDGMIFLTPGGVEYCQANNNKLPKEWDYQRWQKLDQ